MGRTDLKGNPKYETGAARGERETEVDEIVATWTRQHDKHEAMRIVGAAGIPAGAVLDTREIADDPTFEARGIMPVMDHPKVKGYKMPAWPVRHNGAPPPVKASPLLGEHTDEVLGGWLGMKKPDIAKLKTDKVTG
jgi:crotonobetainyl-CoA:carnitine CoA-transferase CaiB-like acyl-CoA transferase